MRTEVNKTPPPTPAISPSPHPILHPLQVLPLPDTVCSGTWTGAGGGGSLPTCEGLLDPAGLRHLHGHRGGDAPRAACWTAGEVGTWGEERAKLNVWS